MSESYCFEELSQQGLILIDTSALLSSMQEQGCNKMGKLSVSNCVSDSANFFKRKINNNEGNLFVTEKVIQEYGRECKRIQDESLAKRRDLIRCFEATNSILSYENLILKGMYKDLIEEYKLLSDTDWNLILSSSVLSSNKRRVFVISNDFTLLDVLSLIHKDKLVADFSRVYGYLRKEFDVFEKFKK